MLKSVLDLVRSLHDTATILKAEFILKDFQEKVEEIDLLKNQLENRLDEELHDIQEQRAALDRREKDARANMVAMDHERTIKPSWSLESSISKIIRDDVRLDDGEDHQTFAKGESDSVVAEPATQTTQILATEDTPDEKTVDSMSHTQGSVGTSDEATGAQETYLDAKCAQSP